MLSDHLTQFLDDHLQAIEVTLLPCQLGLLVLRGASPLDCARHVVDRDHDLPFQGCERQLMDTLLTTIVENSQSPDRVVELVTAMATLADEYISALETHGSLTRTMLDDLFSQRLESEPGAGCVG